MCGYDPFKWYEYDLDNEYLERMKGVKMQGFDRALQEYERKLTDPFADDEYETEEEAIAAYEDAMETKAYYMGDK